MSKPPFTLPFTLPFTKMHGIGNDYVYIEDFEARVADPPALARAVSDRHRGIGGDGLILLRRPEPPESADVRMRMYNADGSEAEMCGNGIRCVCKYAHDHGLVRSRPMRVQTGAGVLVLDYECGPDDRVERVTVDMGPPCFEPARIPVDAAAVTGGHPVWELRLDEQRLEATFVSMGNPHAVLFVDEAGAEDIMGLGPRLERHPAFPNRMNVHAVIVRTPSEVTMHTWERGSGITEACGTGAAAVCVAGAARGMTDRAILAHLPGGDLQLRWDEDTDHVFMTGGATEVFSGVWPMGA